MIGWVLARHLDAEKNNGRYIAAQATLSKDREKIKKLKKREQEFNEAKERAQQAIDPQKKSIRREMALRIGRVQLDLLRRQYERLIKGLGVLSPDLKNIGLKKVKEKIVALAEFKRKLEFDIDLMLSMVKTLRATADKLKGARNAGGSFKLKR